MKRLLLILLLPIFSVAQLGTDAPWMQELLQEKKKSEITLDEIKRAGDAYWETHDKDAKGSGYKPYMRWLSQAEGYLKPDGTIQTQEEIANEMARFSSQKSTNSATSNWMPAGPFIVLGTGSWSTGQGRVNTIAVDPNNSNTYYIGTPGGGVWKSIDAGINWTPLSDFLTEIGVSAIAIDPTNSDIIYIGTGDDDGGDTAGFGMLKSLDGGQTWNPTGLSFPGAGASINEIYLDPNDNNTLFISSEEGFYISTNAGTSVTRTFQGAVDDIKLKPGDSNTIYLSTPSQLFRSTNKGQTFTQVSGLPFNVSRMVIAVTPANPNYVYLLIVDNGQNLIGVYRSNNSGASFTKRDNGVDVLESPQAWFDLALAVSPTNPELVFTGCLNVWRSLNGGSSFSKVNSWSNPTGASYTHADIHQLRYFGNELFASTDGGIYRNADSGAINQSFTDLTATAQIGQFYRIAVSKQSSADMIGGLQDNGGQARSGNQWKNFYGADGMDGGIDPSNPNVRFGFIQNGGGLYFTNNGGNSSLGSIQAPTGGNWITPLKVDNAGTIYAGYNRLYKVQNNSFVTVSLAFNNNIDVIEIDPNNDNIIYLAINSSLFRSLNAGISFNTMQTFSNDITAIEVSHEDTNVIYVATRGSNGQVLKSSNQGVSFSNITSNLPNLGKNTIAHQPLSADGEIYVGTTRGVFKYAESTGQWDNFSNNLPNVNVRDLEINVNDNILTAATYGRGIWQTTVTAATPNDDIGFAPATSATNNGICGSGDVDVVVINNGINAINTFDLAYGLNGGAVISNTYNVTIAPQTTYTVSLNGLATNLGANILNLQLAMSNDTFSSNNSLIIDLRINHDAVANDIYGFENRPFLVENNSGNVSVWERGAPSGVVLNQTGSGSNAYATNLNGDYNNQSIDYLYTGCYDLASMNNPVVQFDMAFEIELDWDLLYMEYSTDNGATWNVLGTATDPNWYNSSTIPNLRNCFNCIGSQWTGNATTMQQYSYDLNALTNEPSVAFRFVMHTDQAVVEEGAVIDNFVVTGILSNETTTLENNFSVFPNPSQGNFTLRWDNNESYNYAVYDVSGKLIVAENNVSGTTHQLDINGVAQGMYFLNISSGTTTFTEKLLVR